MSTDHFLMNAGHSADSQWLTKALSVLPDGITEIGVHPGVDEEWRRIDTEDCFLNCRQSAERLNIGLISFNDI